MGSGTAKTILNLQKEGSEHWYVYVTKTSSKPLQCRDGPTASDDALDCPRLNQSITFVERGPPARVNFIEMVEFNFKDASF